MDIRMEYEMRYGKKINPRKSPHGIARALFKHIKPKTSTDSASFFNFDHIVRL